MNIDYSVIIRTTGKAKEKYEGLLSSISVLEPRPKEIIVVLPEGYDLPNERLGWETFYFSEKGMIEQRLAGINHCKTEYALICDDDIQFERDFVQQLFKPIHDGFCSISIGPLYSFLPPKGIKSFVSAIMAGASPTVFHKNRYNTILRTTGYSYNRKLSSTIPYYETQSAPWTCFFIKTDCFHKIDFESEKWLGKHGYAAMDDQTMFYKACLRGIKTMVVTNAEYQHLDAQTSKQNNKEPVLFSSNFNRVVFWHRFIYTQQKNPFMKLWSGACFAYYSFWMFLYDILGLIRKRLSKKDFTIKCKGYKSGWEFLKTDEYKNMPSVT